MKRQMPDPIGERFGEWTVVGPAPLSPAGIRHVHCRCGCGVEKSVELNALRHGKTLSCRKCSARRRRQTVRRHGHTVGYRRSPEYETWRNMAERCIWPGHKSYARYGGRGITVHPSWLGRGGFEQFLEHIGRRPSPRHSLDRIDNDGHYLPGNVRWATASEQAQNRRSTRWFTIGGETLCLTEWARRYGLQVDTVHARLRRGWPIERALTPVQSEVA